MVRQRFACQTDRLEKLLTGALSRHEELELDAHLGACLECRDALEAMAADRSWWSDLPRLREREPDLEHALGGDDDYTLGFLEPSDQPGSLGRLGPYEVSGVLGRGGMGVVLRAFDPALHRPVAIKVIAPQLATSAAARRRFAREARAAAAVSHDHVVAIHAVAESREGLPYLVMPYIPGRSLQERIDETGPLGVAEILRIGKQTAAGLAAAHAQGLVHRDIKPANILLENGVERVKITDFGLARVADDANASHSGFIAGTPQYMAPEQAHGEAVDARADLFSLGSVLYAMATGHSPFRAATNVAILRRVCEDTPRPIREINPEIPAWLATIIARLHAKVPAGRFESAAEVADLLERCLAYLERPEGPPPYRTDTPRRRRAGRGLTGIAALGFLALGAAELGGFTHVLGTVFRIATPDGTLVVEVDDPDITVKLDDQDLVITGAGPREIRLNVGTHRLIAARGGTKIRDELVTITKDQKRTVVIRLEPDEITASTTPSTARDRPTMIAVPDRARPGPLRPEAPKSRVVAAGPEIAGADYADLLQPVPLDDDSPAPLWPGQAITFMAYQHDGTLLAMASNLDRKILLFDLPSRQLRETLQGHSARVMDMAFSPDGTKLAVATGHWSSSARSGEVWLWELNKPGAQGIRVATGIPMVFAVAFSPDGKTLAYGGWDDVASLYDLATGKVRAVCRGHEEKVRSLAFSPDGKLLASGSSDKSVRLWDSATGNALGDPFPRLRCEVVTVAFSPDGSCLAALSHHFEHAPEPGIAQITVWEVASRRDVASLNGHPSYVSRMAYSPDGRTLASAGGVDNKSGEVILWDVATWTPRATLGGFPSAVESLAFAPGGKSLIAATTHLGVRSEVRVWDLDPPINPREAIRMPGEGESTRVWSLAFAPDGKSLACGLGTWNVHGRLWLWDLAARSGHIGDRTRLGIRALAYAPGGNRAALGTFDGALVIHDFKKPESLTMNGHQGTINAVAFSPDGKYLATGSQDGATRLWDAATGTERSALPLVGEEVWSLAFSPDGTTLAFGVKSGSIGLLNIASGRIMQVLTGHELGVGGVAYTPDGSMLVTGGWDRTVRLWDAGSGTCLAVLEGHRHPVTSVAVAPDGRWIASSEGSATDTHAPARIVLWDLKGRKRHARLSGHRRPIWSVMFSPDGKILASGSDDGFVKLWDVPGPAHEN